MAMPPRHALNAPIDPRVTELRRAAGVLLWTLQHWEPPHDERREPGYMHAIEHVRSSDETEALRRAVAALASGPERMTG